MKHTEDQAQEIAALFRTSEFEEECYLNVDVHLNEGADPRAIQSHDDLEMLAQTTESCEWEGSCADLPQASHTSRT